MILQIVRIIKIIPRHPSHPRHPRLEIGNCRQKICTIILGGMWLGLSNCLCHILLYLNSYLVKGPEVSAPVLNNSDTQRLYNMGLQIELIVALLNGLLALNIHVLIAKSTSIPKALDNPFLAPLYLLSLQLLVAYFAAWLFYRVTDQTFQFQRTKTILLMLVYGVFPLPIMVVWVCNRLTQTMCCGTA